MSPQLAVINAEPPRTPEKYVGLHFGAVSVLAVQIILSINTPLVCGGVICSKVFLRLSGQVLCLLFSVAGIVGRGELQKLPFDLVGQIQGLYETCQRILINALISPR